MGSNAPCLRQLSSGPCQPSIDYSIFGIGVVGNRALKWLFPQEKATFHSAQKVYVYSESALNSHQLPLNIACHPRLLRRGQHVHFAAHAELRQIDSRLDREARGRQNAALVVGFKIIEVSARPMNLVCDVVPGAMGKKLAKSCLANHSPRRIIGLIPTNHIGTPTG